MTRVHTLFTCLFILIQYSTKAITPQNNVFSYNYLQPTAADYNQVNPHFNYPEVHKVNNSLANIPYQGQSYSGYITTNTSTQSKIFYMVYPAGGSKNPDANFNNSAPVILWLQGGPGCADGTGNYAELGPVIIKRNEKGELIVGQRDINWNDDYHLLFVDSPAGVGYSVSGGEIYKSAMTVASYLQTFMIRFFQIYTSLAKNDFHIFGESYGGKYVPALASIIVQNVTNNNINIKGIGVGNGCTKVYTQAASTSDLSMSLSLLDQNFRDQLAVVETKFRKLIGQGDFSDGHDEIDHMTEVFKIPNPNLNMYNFEQYIPNDAPSPPFVDWLNLNSTKLALGVDPNVTYKDCVSCKDDFKADMATNYAPNYTYLLSQNILPDFKVLIYGGQNDIVCNNLGAQKFIRNLSWQGVPNFVSITKKILKDKNNQVVGSYKHYDRLTFAIIFAAGHMVPTDQPTAARLILDYYIKNKFNDNFTNKAIQ